MIYQHQLCSCCNSIAPHKHEVTVELHFCDPNPATGRGSEEFAGTFEETCMMSMNDPRRWTESAKRSDGTSWYDRKISVANGTIGRQSDGFIAPRDTTTVG